MKQDKDEQNYKKAPRRSWARSQMENPDSNREKMFALANLAPWRLVVTNNPVRATGAGANAEASTTSRKFVSNELVDLTG